MNFEWKLFVRNAKLKLHGFEHSTLAVKNILFGGFFVCIARFHSCKEGIPLRKKGIAYWASTIMFLLEHKVLWYWEYRWYIFNYLRSFVVTSSATVVDIVTSITESITWASPLISKKYKNCNFIKFKLHCVIADKLLNNFEYKMRKKIETSKPIRNSCINFDGWMRSDVTNLKKEDY